MTELCEQIAVWHEDYPAVALTVLCQTVALPRGTFYGWRRRQQAPRADRRHQAPGRAPRGYSVTQSGTKISDGQLMEWIVDILETENAEYGYHKITWSLRRHYALVISFKKVYRLLKEMQLLWPQRQRKPQHPRRLARNWVITHPNQLWQTDITYGYVAGEDRFFYLQAIIDVCDRMIVAYHIGLRCVARDAAHTLQEAVEVRHHEWGSEGPVVRTDNGPQFTAQAFEAQCEALGLEHERIPVATPNMNAFIESWHAQLERECFGQEFATYVEAYAAVSHWIEAYNTRRLHGSLDFWSPHAMRERVQQGLAHWIPVRA
ncbi:MAG: IS3 family transposase [Gemmataceae bacterium]